MYKRNVVRLFIYCVVLAIPFFCISQTNPKGLLITQNQNIAEIFNRGEELRHGGEFEQAASSYANCISLAIRNGSIKDALNATIQLAVVQWNIGQMKDSSKSYANALLYARVLGYKDKEAFCSDALLIHDLYNQGKELRAKGEYAKSIESFQKAIFLARNHKSLDLELKCLRQLSLCYWEQNIFSEFFNLNKKSLTFALQLKNKKDEGLCLNNMGLYYWKIDNYSKALEYYEKALVIAKDLKNIEDQTERLNNIGIIYKEIGNYDKALAFLTQALQLDKKSTNIEYVSIDLNNIGTTYRKKGLLSGNKMDFQKALEYFNDCLKLTIKSNDTKTKIRIINNIGTIHNDLELYDEALKYYDQGLKLSAYIQDKEIKSFILNNIGIVYYNLGDYQESTKYCQKAIDLALEIKSGQVLWEAFLDLGNSYKKQSKYSDALSNYKNSINIIESARSNLELEEMKAGYFGSDKRIEAYHNIIDLLARLHAAEPQKSYGTEAFEYMEKAKARAFLDSLEVSEVAISSGIDFRLANREKKINQDITALYKKLLIPDLTPEQKNDIDEKLKTAEDDHEKLKREIRSTSPAYANLKYPKLISLKEAQGHLLDNETAFIAYSIGKDVSYGFAFSKSALKIFPIPPRKDIQLKVTNYLKVLSDKDSRDFTAGFELFAELVQPGLDNRLKRLIIIPDDVLYFLPFESLLMDRDSNSWLIKKYTMAYAPSVSSLSEIIKRGDLRGNKNSKDILAFGDPDYGPYERTNEKTASPDVFQKYYSSADFRFFRLNYSGVEVRKIAALFKANRKDIFLRGEATEQDLKRLPLNQYKIVHFAAHGLIDDEKPARSAIVLSLDQQSQEDGFVQIREIFNLRLSAALVSLSACQTGKGAYIRGEGIEGLSRAFFYAGASSVLMSLWSINDQASSQLMERFYRHLRSSASLMDALQKAKLEMIRSDVFAHPYYWASFVISGNATNVIFPKKTGPWAILVALSLALGAFTFWRAGRSSNKKRVLTLSTRTDSSS